jgi:hypothetical protein
MPDLSGLWRALQNIGVAGITMIILWAITRGELVTKRAHGEVIGEKDQRIEELEREVRRLETIIGVLGGDRVGDD